MICGVRARRSRAVQHDPALQAELERRRAMLREQLKGDDDE